MMSSSDEDDDDNNNNNNNGGEDSHTTTADYCDRSGGRHDIAHSSETDAFDISSSFNDVWYKFDGTPIDLYFFEQDEEKDDPTDNCGAFLNNGKCDTIFNTRSHGYDDGDCCSSTCTGSSCGIGKLVRAFGQPDSVYGDGFPDCIDPGMVPITIVLHDVFDGSPAPSHNEREVFSGGNGTATKAAPGPGMFSEVIEPLLLLDCDDRNVLTVRINREMAGGSEIVMVEDGANCTMRIQNSTSATTGFAAAADDEHHQSSVWYVNYTVFHGNASSSAAAPIAVVHEQSNEREFVSFERIPECYLSRLSGHINNNATIYTGTGPHHRAIEWMMRTEGSSRNTPVCEDYDDDTFLDRFALSVLNFAAPVVPPPPPQQRDADIVPTGSGTEPGSSQTTGTASYDDKLLWINEHRHCIWRNVECNMSSVESLHLHGFGLQGTIASSIGLLTKLTKLDLGDNRLFGTIPTEVGLLTSLKRLRVDGNSLSGTIPREIGKMTRLEVLNLSNNSLTGPIPTELTRLAASHNLKRIYAGYNNNMAIDDYLSGELRDIVHTNCVICSSQRQQQPMVNASLCPEFLVKFNENRRMLTIDDCEVFNAHCFGC